MVLTETAVARLFHGMSLHISSRHANSVAASLLVKLRQSVLPPPPVAHPAPVSIRPAHKPVRPRTQSPQGARIIKIGVLQALAEDPTRHQTAVGEWLRSNKISFYLNQLRGIFAEAEKCMQRPIWFHEMLFANGVTNEVLDHMVAVKVDGSYYPAEVRKEKARKAAELWMKHCVEPIRAGLTRRCTRLGDMWLLSNSAASAMFLELLAAERASI